MDKLKIWQPGLSWETAEKKWDKKSSLLNQTHPLKTLGSLPKMPGITEETAQGLKWKSLKYLLTKEAPQRVFFRYFFKHPIRYTLQFIKSAWKKHSYSRDGDFFYYGIQSVDEFQNLLSEENILFVIGFSYCHKPHECPSGRFSPECVRDPDHPVCRQCFIGKAVNALPLHQDHIRPLFIPTIHYIGEQLFQLREEHPDKKILFLITACEMTLEMFGDWGNMIQAQGIGVRLDGRICNTMKAFELSEAGIKPGLTVVLPDTQMRILDIIKMLWSRGSSASDETV